MTTVLYEVRDGVALLTLNRPEKLNALSPELLDELEASLDRAGGDPEVRVVVIRGAGRAFSTGYDLEAFAHRPLLSPEAWRERHRRNIDRWLRIWNLPKPVIAQVHGYVLAGACEMTLACDLTVAAEGTRFGEPEIRDVSGPPTMFMPWVLGLKKTKELLLTGDLVDAREAERIGLINRVVPAERLEEQTLALAHRLARLEPAALAFNKVSINRTYEVMGLLTALSMNQELMALIHLTEDSLAWRRLLSEEGVRAFLQARRARFGDEA